MRFESKMPNSGLRVMKRDVSAPDKKEVAVRDPVHGFIRLDRYDFITNLVATPEFQRLRHINQLGMSTLVYPSATHNRFNHSLGAMHVMEMILDHLQRVGDIGRDREAETLVKCGLAAALLHDIGHGPLSHSSENWFYGFKHEEISAQIITRPPISDILGNHVEPRRVVSILKGTSRGADVLLSQLVSSALDADRLDYLMRDDHFTGAGFGRIDLDRMIEMLRVYKKGGILQDHAVTLYKGRFSIESYVLGRYLMYEAVYFHKATRSAEQLVLNAIQRAVDIKAFEGLPTCLDFLRSKSAPSVDQILEMDDHTIFYLLRRWKDSTDPVLRDLCTRIYDRDLLKAIELDREMYRMYHKGVEEEMTAIARKRGFDPKYLCSIDSTSDTPYTYYRPRSTEDAATTKDSIFVIDRDGEASEISNIPGNAVVRALSETVYHDRLYVPDEIRAEVEQLFKRDK